jgi:hypothetical protein
VSKAGVAEETGFLKNVRNQLCNQYWDEWTHSLFLLGLDSGIVRIIGYLTMLLKCSII